MLYEVITQVSRRGCKAVRLSVTVELCSRRRFSDDGGYNVITSYSIHYTKLYDDQKDAKRAQKSAFKPVTRQKHHEYPAGGDRNAVSFGDFVEHPGNHGLRGSYQRQEVDFHLIAHCLILYLKPMTGLSTFLIIDQTRENG